jgi:hypothetical protein
VTDSRGGFASAAVRVTSYRASTLELEVTSPLEGDATSNHYVQVTGTVTNPSGTETGVTVNGVPAVLMGDQFAAGDVRLLEGENTLTAVATDLQGNTASTSLAIQHQRDENDLRLYAVHYSGVVPFETILGMEAPFGVSDPSLSAAGPGEVDCLLDLFQTYERGLWKIEKF